MGLRSFFDKIEPNFTKGGKYEKYFPIYEMVESFIYTPKTVTTVAPHARSYIDMKRIMTYVVLATVPCILFGMYNVGLQTNMAIAEYGASGWRAAIIEGLGIGFNYQNPLANILHGAAVFPADLHRDAGRGRHLRGDLLCRARARGERGLPRDLDALHADHAGLRAAVAGGPGDHLRRRDRQGGLWRHRQELPQPGAGGPCVPVFRLSGADVGRHDLDAGGRLFRRDRAGGQRA